jgi:hypothetical protein
MLGRQIVFEGQLRGIPIPVTELLARQAQLS